MKAWRPQTASSKPEAMKGSVLAFHSGWRWGSLFFGPILIYLGLCAASRFFCSRRAAGLQDDGGVADLEAGGPEGPCRLIL